MVLSKTPLDADDLISHFSPTGNSFPGSTCSASSATSLPASNFTHSVSLALYTPSYQLSCPKPQCLIQISSRASWSSPRTNGPTLRSKKCVHCTHFALGLSNSRPQFKAKPFGDRDVDIKIDACGVCGSDVHTINGGWGDAPMPLCVGHEVIGKAIKVGDKVSTVKVGDRVGVGAQIGACLECKNCKSDNENYCPHMVGKY